MTTVRICSTLPEAQVVQSHLEGSGIKGFLPDELTVQNDWMLSNAIGGVRVQVLDEDVERAAELLQGGTISGGTLTAAKCPHCGAVLKETYGFGLYPKIVLALLLSIPIRSQPIWRCSECGVVPNSAATLPI